MLLMCEVLCPAGCAVNPPCQVALAERNDGGEFFMFSSLGGPGPFSQRRIRLQ